VNGRGEPNWQPISMLATIASLIGVALRTNFAGGGDPLATLDPRLASNYLPRKKSLLTLLGQSTAARCNRNY
jgi:hypothetical protein